jgi:HEAT repeat protein
MLVLLWPFLLTLAPVQGEPGQGAEELVRQLSSEDVEERSRAAKALKALGSAAIPPLQAALLSSDKEVSATARVLLRYIDADRRLSANLKKSFPTFPDRLAGGTDRLWLELVLGFGPGGWRAPATLKEEDYSILLHEAVKQPLSNEEKKTVLHLIGRKVVRSCADIVTGYLKDGESEVRIDAVGACEHLHTEKAIPDLIGLLDDNRSDTRWRAAHELVCLGCKEAAAKYLVNLESPDPERRKLAVFLLGRLQCKEHSIAVEKVLEDADYSVREKAMDAVADLGLTTSIPRLRILLSSERLRSRAARTLADLDATEAFEDVASCLSPDRAGAVAPLFSPLRYLDASRAGPLIAPFLKHVDPRTRKHAVYVLADADARKWSAEIAAMLADPEVGTVALIALSASNARESLPDLTPWLRSKDSGERLDAGIAAANMRSSRYDTDLVRVLNEPDLDGRFRILDRFGTDLSRELLDGVMLLLKDEDDRISVSAGRLLCANGRREGVDAVLKGEGPFGALNALQNPDAWARWKAAKAPVLRSDFRRGLVVQAAERMHVDLEWPAELSARGEGWALERAWFPGGAEGFTNLGILETALEGGPYEFVLLNDRLVLMERPSARRYWTYWRAQENRRK